MYPGTHSPTQPDKPAIVLADTGETRTYAELDQNSIKLARYLRAAGVQPGQNIAFLSDNLPQVFEIYWAGLRSGFYVTGVNHHLTGDEAAYILNDCEAHALLVSSAHLDTAAEVVALVPSITTVVMIDPDGAAPEGFVSYSDVLVETADDPLDGQPRGADMLYSSGTTGQPKGIRAPLPGHEIDAQPDMLTTVFGHAYGFDENTVYYSPAPTYHAAPLRFGGMVHALGGTLVMSTRFDARTALEVIETYHVTHSQWVPTMFVRMLKLPDEERLGFDVSSMRVAVHAAAPCPVEVKQRMIDWWGPVLYEYYSSTEANGVTMIAPDEWLTHPGTVGRAAVGVIRICSEDGVELPVGEDGVVYFERDEPPFTYHNDPGKTAAATHPEHATWTTTGDIGHVDDDGYLYLTDRLAFTIISGGVNIYPQEIENALALHPAILDVAVVGVPDDDFGEVPRAYVQLASDAAADDATAQAILDSLDGRLARYKMPRSVVFVDSLPRTATGKLAKGLLRPA